MVLKNDIIPSMMKKEPRGVNPNPSYLDELRSVYEDDSGQYVYVEFNDVLKNWGQGKAIIANITNLLHMERKDLSDTT